MTLFEKGKKERPISTVAQDVYDVTGAGDTVISSFTLAHVSGASLFEAAQIANHAAGIVVGKAGTATVSTKEILQSIIKERGSLDLSYLEDMPIEEARDWLTKFKGVGPKTAAIVLCFSLNRPAFPVDTHVYRLTGRIGLRPEKITVEQAHPYLEGIFPPETYYAAHLNIIRLGREVCNARKPNCPACPVRELCDYESKTE